MDDREVDEASGQRFVLLEDAPDAAEAGSGFGAGDSGQPQSRAGNPAAMPPPLPPIPRLSVSCSNSLQLLVQQLLMCAIAQGRDLLRISSHAR